MQSAWWKQSIVYQIYPKSFRDADGDGVGDLRGIIENLPYLQRLGVGTLWLSPIFGSPMIDNGYDVSDYKAVHPQFGTLADVDELIEEAKKRDLRVVLDIALNHTSTAHPWFSDPGKRDWYMLHAGSEGELPNNWRSVFGGPAWSRAGDAWYLHLFDKTQADLNWENPAVRAAIHDSMRFWLDRGIAGFRLDVVTLISKPPGLPDIPFVTLNQFYGELAKGPRLQEFLRDMRREVFAHYDCVAIGEAPGVDPALAAKLVDPADPMLDLLYHFDLVDPPHTPIGDWDRIAFKRVFTHWDQGIGARGWNTVVLSNHDLGRIISRFGDEKLSFESATALAALVLLQRGTPFLYQGDELGLVNCPFPDIEALDDVWAKTTYRLALERGASHAEAFAEALAMTRDHARWPMPWTDGPNAGFSAGKPWLQLHPDAAQMAASAQEADAGSVLAFVRKLIALRKSDPVWTEGDYLDLAPEHPDLFAFERRLGVRVTRVVLNLRNRETPAPDWARDAVTLSNGPGIGAQLAPWEARIYAGGTPAVQVA